MAHKKGGEGLCLVEVAEGQRGGVRAVAGETVATGAIIVRERGTKFRPGLHVGIGRDHTIYSLVDGHVRFDYAAKNKKRVNVDPAVS